MTTNLIQFYIIIKPRELQTQLINLPKNIPAKKKKTNPWELAIFFHMLGIAINYGHMQILNESSHLDKRRMFSLEMGKQFVGDEYYYYKDHFLHQSIINIIAVLH